VLSRPKHHLSLVTKLPCIHYFFSGETLVKAYYEILEGRDSEAYWYKRDSAQLKSWERNNTINGTTLSRFCTLLKHNSWKVILHSKKPLGSIGRKTSRKRTYRVLSKFFYPLVLIPGLQEIFLHRITFILEKDKSYD
jgi:hypothetical protein